jgi:hypothetical protein
MGVPSVVSAMNNSGSSGGWIGGANVPTKGGGRVDLSLPFAELIVGKGYLELRLRGLIPRLWQPETLIAKPEDLELIWPIGNPRRISALFRFVGVGFKRVDGEEFYFKTGSIRHILDCLEAAGFTITRVNGAARKVWHDEP